MNERDTTKHQRGRNRSATDLVHLGLDDDAVGAVEPARGNVLHRRRPAHHLGLLPEERVRERRGRSPESARPANRRSTAAAAMLTAALAR